MAKLPHGSRCNGSPMQCVVILVMLWLLAAAIDERAFEEALGQWSAEELVFYQEYQPGADRGPLQPQATAAVGASSNAKVSLETLPRQKSARSVEDQLVDELAALRSSDSSTDSNDGPATDAPEVVIMDQDDDGNLAPTTAAPSAETDAPSQPPSIAPHVASFSDVCGQDSSDLCSEPNPFNATFCLVSKKESLSKDCRDYITAKVNCYMSTAKLCAGSTSHLKCLFQHRFNNALPRVCTRTRFFDYVRAGVSFKDVMLDQAVATLVGR